MAKITIKTIVSGFRSAAALDSNFQAITNELNTKVLYRDNPAGEDNAMQNHLDMNSNRILNLPMPSSATEAARYQDVLNGVVTTDTVLPSPIGGDGLVLSTSGDIYTLQKLHKDTIALMTVVSKSVLTNNDIARVSAYATAGDNGGGNFYWDAASTATANGGTIFAADEGGTGRWIRIIDDVVTVRMFGAKGDGVTDDEAAILAADAATDALTFGPGVYNFDNKLLLGQVDGKTYSGVGAELHHTGTGVGVQFGLDSGSAAYFTRTNNLRITGNANTTHSCVVRATHHGNFTNLNARDCTLQALRLEWCVDNLFPNYSCSANEDAFIVQPTNGVFVTHSGIVGEFSVGYNFPNIVIEGVSGDGVVIEAGDMGVFSGGTSEANTQGVFIDDSVRTNFRNTFNNIWFEANPTYDFLDKGVGTTLNTCHLTSSPTTQPNITALGSMLTINGGFVRWIELDVAGSDTRFNNVIFSDTGSVGIQGIGSKQVRGCSEADTAGIITATLPNNVGTNILANQSAPVLNKTGDGTIYTIIFNEAVIDTGDEFNESTGVFTAKERGIYLVSVTCQLSGITTANDIDLRLVSSVRGARLALSGGAGKTVGGALQIKGTINIDMNVGSTLSITIAAGGNGSNNMGISGGASSLPLTYLSIIKVG